jgi:hypothetical protein
MTDPERVRIGKCQTHPAANAAVVLDDAVVLATDVLSGHLHLRQKAANRFFESGVDHRRVL